MLLVGLGLASSSMGLSSLVVCSVFAGGGTSSRVTVATWSWTWALSLTNCLMLEMTLPCLPMTWPMSVGATLRWSWMTSSLVVSVTSIWSG